MWISEPCFARVPSVFCLLSLFSAFDGVLQPHEEDNQKGTSPEIFLEGATAYGTLMGSHPSPGYSSERTGDTGKTEACTEGCSAKPMVGAMATPVKTEAYAKTSSSRSAMMLHLLLTSTGMLSSFCLLLNSQRTSLSLCLMPVLVLQVILPDCPVSTTWLHK